MPDPHILKTPAWQRHAALLALSLCTLLVHGYHPFAEDGGLYVAGVEYRLKPTLFPHDTAFVSAHLAYSAFSPVLAALVKAMHLPLPWLLFLIYLASLWTMLYAALRISRAAFASEQTAFFATALLACWFTLPIAGTSLLLMDPYVTARTLSTPMALLAIAFALEPAGASRKRSIAYSCASLLAAAAFHPLMACYAASFVCALLIARSKTLRSRAFGWTALAAAAVFIAAVLQASAAPEAPATLAADISRYYWFPSQWQWFELLGLAGPLVVLALALRSAIRRNAPKVIALCRAGLGLGIIAAVIALLFAQQHFRSHAVARLQPLRAFLLIYAVMTLIVGGVAAEFLAEFSARRRTRLSALAAPALLLIAASAMVYVQRQTFHSSQHLELPWRAPTNPWSQAFLWARDHTPPDALFALDANYITQPGEDAQTFRATAQRSVLADLSKDGGEAAITPSLADTWFTQSSAQKNLSLLSDTDRDARLQPFGVTWMVLRSSATTIHACPYDNGVVKVCSNSQPQPVQPRP